MVQLLSELGLSKEVSHKLLYDMIEIRRFEELVEKLFQQGKVHGTMHLCIGQEATAVGACYALNKKDMITSTHRGHGHSLAKGMRADRMLAELLGKETGYCKGKGGSMHIADLDVGNLGANGIVAAGLPLGVGAALTSKMKKLGYVVLCFFGDGATNEGAFHEALNLASIWDLPIVFFCENNLYAMSASIHEMTRVKNIADRSIAYGIEGITIDGNDILQVIQTTSAAVEKARNGGGPTLIEAHTYRWKGHSKSDARKYRSREEEQKWRKEHDPIMNFIEQLKFANYISELELQSIQDQVDINLKHALEFAENSPEPNIDSLTQDIYTGEVKA